MKYVNTANDGFLTAEYVKSVLDYDPNTGIFYWKSREDIHPSTNAKFAGKVAGSIKRGRTPHIRIKLQQVDFQAHRLAWLIVHGYWPTMDLDHIDGNPQNNKIINLRYTNASLNGMNRGKQLNNTTGLKGVVFDKSRNKFAARIKVNQKMINLGRFDCVAAAHFAYQIACDKIHGEFGRAF